MKFRIIIILIISGAFGVFGFNWVKNFIEVDRCLDGGGRWNYETNTCEFSDRTQPSLKGTVWISENEVGGFDSLIFTSANEVTYYLEEVTWDFRSTYTMDGNIVTVLTKTYELEVENPDNFEPNLKQKYRFNDLTLELIYEADFRNEQWNERSTENLNDFKRLK